jgi:hypothetical protein
MTENRFLIAAPLGFNRACIGEKRNVGFIGGSLRNRFASLLERRNDDFRLAGTRTFCFLLYRVKSRDDRIATIAVAAIIIVRFCALRLARASNCFALVWLSYRMSSCARTDKVTLRWSVARSNARRRKPQGEGGGSWDMAGKSGRACLGGRGTRLPRGRQAGSDLTRVKSDKKRVVSSSAKCRRRI